MIKKIILHNFQSHAHSEIDFSEGITSIVGESDNGKTAILRAFQWVWKNRPSGMDFVSHWATTTNTIGNVLLSDTCYVTVVFKEGKYVTREKNEKGFNGYHIGDYIDGEFVQKESFGKIGVSVPFPVVDLFNMEDVNIQNQHDSMFLLSDTGQDVARFFNKLIKLDKADTALSISESRKRSAKKLVTEIEEEIQETQEALNKLDWVESAEKMVEKINLSSSKAEKVSDDIYDLDQMIDNIIYAAAKCELPEYHKKAEMIIDAIEGLSTKIENLDDKIYNASVLEQDIMELTIKVRDSGWVQDAHIFTERIDGIINTISKKTLSLIQLEETIKDIENCSADMKASDYCEEAKEVIIRIDKLDNTIISNMDKIDDLDLLINKIKSCTSKIQTGKDEIVKLRKLMPETCPLCGNKIQEAS